MNKFSLDQHPKIASGFKVPEDYFDQLPQVVMAKIASEQPKKSKLFTLKNFSFAAAAVLLIALCIPFFTTNAITSLDQIDTVSLENYITYQSYGSQYEVINLMDSNDLDQIQIELNLEDESVENILTTNPNFENYIAE